MRTLGTLTGGGVVGGVWNGGLLVIAEVWGGEYVMWVCGGAGWCVVGWWLCGVVWWW